MTVNAQENQAQEVKQDTTESNLGKQRRMYEAQLQKEQQEKLQLAQELEALKKEKARSRNDDDDEDDSEPYVDKKRFKKGLNQFGEQIKHQTKADIEQAVQVALEQERKSSYLEQNKDFSQMMNEQNLETFMNEHPNVAKGILRMPDGFERQKLVYETMKSLGVGKQKPKEPSIQDKVNANRKSPYYQPTDTGTSPYVHGGDYSDQGKKQAWDKMQQLKKKLRLG